MIEFKQKEFTAVVEQLKDFPDFRLSLDFCNIKYSNLLWKGLGDVATY